MSKKSLELKFDMHRTNLGWKCINLLRKRRKGNKREGNRKWIEVERETKRWSLPFFTTVFFFNSYLFHFCPQINS